MKDLNNKKPKNEVEKLLELSGFSDKEIAVYLSLLELGKATVTEISRKSGVSRTHCYIILGELVSKEIISVLGKEPKQEFMAESPIKLKDYLEEKFLRHKEVFEKVEKLIPDLISIHKTGDRPRVRFYEGIDGLIDVYDDTLTAKEPIVAYACYEDMEPLLPKYFETYYKRRVKNKIFARGIVPETPMAIEHKKRDVEEMRDLSLVPKDKFNFTPDIEIYDNKVMIASWKEKLGIIIESQEISDAMKKIFELAWIGAKNFRK